jgi:putative ABC transport system substrate-binding protein
VDDVLIPLGIFPRDDEATSSCDVTTEPFLQSAKAQIMHRRRFIGAIGSVFIYATVASGQQPGKVFRIGWLSGSTFVHTPLAEVFVAAMRELGWIEGQRYSIENLLSEGHSERFPALAAELVQHKVDLIVTAGTPPTAAAKKATSSIPIVFYFVGDPIGSGFVESLAHPGGNVTGLGGLGTGQHTKQLELLKEAVPTAARIAIMTNSTLKLHAAYRAEVEPAARRLGITLAPVEIGSPEEIDGAFVTVAREKVDALLILGQPFYSGASEKVARLAREQKLPATIAFGELAQAGLLMSFGSRIVDDIRRLPYYIDRILKGAKPGELPVEQPTRFYLTLNLKTAKAIGLAVPQSLMLRADELIQ